MEAEKILSVNSLVSLLGVAVGCDEVLGQLDAHVLGVGTETTELLHIELCFHHILLVHPELQSLLAKLENTKFSQVES